MSDSNVNCNSASPRSCSATRSRRSFGITRVSSLRNSRTSMTAPASPARSLRTTAFCSTSSVSAIAAGSPTGSAVPIQRALFPEIDVTRQQDQDVDQHLYEPEPAQFAIDVGPGVQKDSLDIEQNEHNR